MSQATCYENSAGMAGVLYVREAKVLVNESKMHHNSAITCGVVSIETTAVLEISFSQVYQNKADRIAGVFICH